MKNIYLWGISLGYLYRRSYLKFDLSSIPYGEEVTSVTFNGYAFINNPKRAN